MPGQGSAWASGNPSEFGDRPADIHARSAKRDQSDLIFKGLIGPRRAESARA
jgi:hypothetical protein